MPKKVEIELRHGLLEWLRDYRQIDNAAQKIIARPRLVQLILQRADVQEAWAHLGGVLEVDPVGGDQRLAAVRQNEDELQVGRQYWRAEGPPETGRVFEEAQPVQSLKPEGSKWID